MWGRTFSVLNLINLFIKVNETSTEASLARDSCTADYTTAAQCTYVLCCSAWPNAILPTQTKQILVACYRHRIAILFNEILQLLLDSCLLFFLEEERSNTMYGKFRFSIQRNVPPAHMFFSFVFTSDLY
jgi:hypothetical protein